MRSEVITCVHLGVATLVAGAAAIPLHGTPNVLKSRTATEGIGIAIRSSSFFAYGMKEV